MSYVKTTWADGDVITAQKLNNMEQGIVDASSVSGVLVGTVTEGSTYQMETDLTWKQVYDALKANWRVLLVAEYEYESTYEKV